MWSKGLCYNCDEQFSIGHKCKTKPFVLMMIGDKEELCLHSIFPSVAEVVTDLMGMKEGQVSFNAMGESRMRSHTKLEGEYGQQKLIYLLIQEVQTVS